MNVPFLDLSRGVRTLRTELDAVLMATLDEAQFVSGSAVQAFERAWAEYCGVSHAVGVATGTDAVELALRAAGVGPGDEVIAPANTCVPTIAGIEAAGGVPVLVDVDPATWTIDPAAAVAVVSERTRAIVPVHLYGRCASMDPILELAEAHGLVVVEDAAQAHGAEYRERRAGSLGDAAAFSFYPTKNLGALGDAGAVVTDDADLAERVRELRSYGERERYLSVARGTNSRLDTLQAAVLLAKLPHLDAWLDRRRELARFYRSHLADTSLLLPGEPEDGLHAWHLFVVRSSDRDRFRTALGETGVATAVHYPRAVHEHPAYRHLRRDDALAVSEQLARDVVSLPLYPELTDAEAEAVSGFAATALTSSR